MGKGKVPYSDSTNTAIQTTCSVGVSTTMQDPTAFSYTGGFTTAAAQLQVIEAERSFQQSKKRTDTTVLQDKQANKAFQSHKRSDGQSSLSTFFTKKSSSAALLAANDLADQEHALALTSVNARTSWSETVPLPTLDRHRTTSTSSATITNSPPRRPLSTIPQPFANHHLLNRPPSIRPRPRLPDDSHAANDYVFLSSSPPRATAALQEPEDGPEAAEDMMLNHPTQNNSSSFRPTASCCHTTSMVQLQSSAKGGRARRTLGVKRSLNGWAARKLDLSRAIPSNASDACED